MRTVDLTTNGVFDEAKFHAFRAKGLGSSEIAAVFGESRFMSNLELYQAKVLGPVEPDKATRELFEFGHAGEWAVADMIRRKTGWEVQKVNEGWVHDDHDWLRCNVDRFIPEADGSPGPGIAECKTADQYSEADWPEHDSEDIDAIPNQGYVLQVHHQLAVSGYEWGILAVMFGFRAYRHYFIYRDEDICQTIIRVGGDFWRRIQEQDPPKPDFDHPKIWSAVKRMYPDLTQDHTIELPEFLKAHETTMLDARAFANAQKKVVDGCKARLVHALGDARFGIFPDGTKIEKKVSASGSIRFRHIKADRKAA